MVSSSAFLDGTGGHHVEEEASFKRFSDIEGPTESIEVLKLMLFSRSGGCPE